MGALPHGGWLKPKTNSGRGKSGFPAECAGEVDEDALDVSAVRMIEQVVQGFARFRGQPGEVHSRQVWTMLAGQMKEGLGGEAVAHVSFDQARSLVFGYAEKDRIKVPALDANQVTQEPTHFGSGQASGFRQVNLGDRGRAEQNVAKLFCKVGHRWWDCRSSASSD